MEIPKTSPSVHNPIEEYLNSGGPQTIFCLVFHYVRDRQNMFKNFFRSVTKL